MSDNWRKPESVLLGMEHEMHNALTVRGAQATMSSLELVDFINEDRKARAHAIGAPFPGNAFPGLEHKNFLAKVPDVLGPTSAEFEADLPDVYGRPRRGYRFPKREACLMAMSYSYELQAKVFDRMTELEEANKQKPPTELSRMDILQIAMDAEREKLIAIEQRDEAIRTKSQISDRKTATAMATASAKAREVKRLQQELGRGQMHATVIAVEKALKRKFPANAYVALRKAAKAHGVEPTTVADPRWGTAKAWPAVAWREVHGIELADIFPLGADQ